jgi:catechol 2,3-dioxygenase-like lactoylglutathione lyase family enzyme
VTTRFYAVLGLPRPDADPHRVSVARGDLPRLRGRILAAGARVHDAGETTLAFRDPDGVRVELVAE